MPRLGLTLLLALMPPLAARAAPSPSGATPCLSLDTDIDRAAELRQRDPSAARSRYRQLFDRARAAGCAFAAARASNGLGMVAVMESRLLAAMDHFEAAQEALGAMDEMDSAASGFQSSLTHNLAATYLRLGWLQEARDALRRTLAIYQRDGASAAERAPTLLQLARVERLDGELAAARDAIDRALELETSTSPAARVALLEEAAWVAVAEGRLQAAEARLLEARDLFGYEPLAADGLQAQQPAAGPPPYAPSLANLEASLAEVRLLQGKPVRSLAHAARAEVLLRALERPILDLEAHLQHLRAGAHEGLGDLGTAHQAAEAGLLLLESTRDAWRDLGLGFFAKRRAYVRRRLDLAVRAGDGRDAWDIVERYRARGLLAHLGERARGGARAGQDEARDAEVRALRHRLLAAVRALDSLPFDPPQRRQLAASRLRRFRTELWRLGSRPATAHATAPRAEPLPVVDPQQARELLAGQPLVLVFAVGETSWHLLALDHRGLDLHSLGAGRAELDETLLAVLRTFEAGTQVRDPEGLQRRLAALGQTLLGPLADRLRKDSEVPGRLVVVAEGLLGALPFEALPLPWSGRPLVETHAVVYLPSFSVLRAIRHRLAACRRPGKDLLALGDPIFGSRDPDWPAALPERRSADEALEFVRLEASAREAGDIAELYTAARATATEAGTTAQPPSVRLLLRDQAHHRALMEAAPRYRVLHLASHARTDLQVPQRSKLALSCAIEGADAQFAGDDTSACDLYLPEIAGLDLCGPLVVLSACATAAGPTVDGEGTLGLPRAFLHAGASAVVASRWRVDDRATAPLMVAFHRHLLALHDPAEALRRAQQELRAAGHPLKSWAAFALTGDPRSPF